MYPLYDILRGRKPTPKVDWSAEGDAAFAAATLAHRSPHTPIAMTTDPLDYVVVAVHKQWINGTWQPLVFFSRQQRPAERQYSTFDHLPWSSCQNLGPLVSSAIWQDQHGGGLPLSVPGWCSSSGIMLIWPLIKPRTMRCRLSTLRRRGSSCGACRSAPKASLSCDISLRLPRFLRSGDCGCLRLFSLPCSYSPPRLHCHFKHGDLSSDV